MTELSTVDREELVDAISDAITQQQAVAQRELYIESGGVKVRYAKAKRGHVPLEGDTIVALAFVVGGTTLGVLAILAIT